MNGYLWFALAACVFAVVFVFFTAGAQLAGIAFLLALFVFVTTVLADKY